MSSYNPYRPSYSASRYPYVARTYPYQVKPFPYTAKTVPYRMLTTTPAATKPAAKHSFWQELTSWQGALYSVGLGVLMLAAGRATITPAVKKAEEGVKAGLPSASGAAAENPLQAELNEARDTIAGHAHAMADLRQAHEERLAAQGDAFRQEKALLLADRERDAEGFRAQLTDKDHQYEAAQEEHRIALETAEAQKQEQSQQAWDANAIVLQQRDEIASLNRTIENLTRETEAHQQAARVVEQAKTEMETALNKRFDARVAEDEVRLDGLRQEKAQHQQAADVARAKIETLKTQLATRTEELRQAKASMPAQAQRGMQLTRRPQASSATTNQRPTRASATPLANSNAAPASVESTLSASHATPTLSLPLLRHQQRLEDIAAVRADRSALDGLRDSHGWADYQTGFLRDEASSTLLDARLDVDEFKALSSVVKEQGTPTPEQTERLAVLKAALKQHHKELKLCRLFYNYREQRARLLQELTESNAEHF